MLYSFVAFVIVLATAATAAAADASPEVIFPAKVFDDFVNIVHVEGTLSGNGIGYSNNHTVLTCYHQKQECSAIQIDSKGLQVFSVNLPLPYAVRAWTDESILADGDLPCGGHETWIIDRVKKTAELIEQPCSDTRTYHWTIEDPPFWKEFKARLGAASRTDD